MDFEDETDMLAMVILQYMLEQKKLGREIITEKEIFEVMGEPWDDGENRMFRLSDLGENVISMAEYKRKLN